MSKYRGIDKETILKIKEVRFPFASGCIDLDIKSVLESADEINKALENHQNKLMNDTEMRIICEMAMKYLEELDAKEEYKEEAYNKGLEDAWEFARKIFRLNNHSMFGIFGHREKRSVFDLFDAQEALAKIEAYEKEQNEIKVGDVVEQNECKFVIIFVNNEFVNGIDENGRFSHILIENCKKTGKHIDIQSILQQIKE